MNCLSSSSLKGEATGATRHAGTINLATFEKIGLGQWSQYFIGGLSLYGLGKGPSMAVVDWRAWSLRNCRRTRRRSLSAHAREFRTGHRPDSGADLGWSRFTFAAPP